MPKLHTLFQIWGSLRSSKKLLAQSAVRVSKVKGQREGLTLAFFLISRLLCCAHAIYCAEKQKLVTEQAPLLSKESLFRQQASGPSYAIALVLYLLLH